MDQLNQSAVYGGMPPAVPMIPGTVTRPLNTAFQPSATRPAFVVYSVQTTVTASIAGGQNGDIFLESADDAAFTTNVRTLSVIGQGQTYTLAIALQGVQPQSGVLAGMVDTGGWLRMRSSNNLGSPGYTFRAGAEILM